VDRLDGPVEVGGERSRRAAEQQRVAVAVQGDLVACRGDLGGERRAPLDLLADEEERRGHACRCEQLEHGGRALRMRAVVERERDPVLVREPQGDPEGGREQRHVRGRRRRAPRRARADGSEYEGSHAGSVAP